MFISAEAELKKKTKKSLLQENRRVNAQLCQGCVRALKITETKGEAAVKPGQVD